MSNNKTIKISTGHMTLEDAKVSNEILARTLDGVLEPSKDLPFIMANDKYSLTVGIDQRLKEEKVEDIPDMLESIYLSGFSLVFVGIYYWALTNGYTKVILDCDADVHDDLPVFDW